MYIGVDLGTSAVKLLLVDGQGQILNTVTKEYPLEFPKPGWSQQAPADWRKAVMEGIPELLSGFDGAQVTAGGVRTEEFDPATMQSRLVPGLYAAGEVLDIDGDCGGYNLQWAWASGRLAGMTLE